MVGHELSLGHPSPSPPIHPPPPPPPFPSLPRPSVFPEMFFQNSHLSLTSPRGLGHSAPYVAILSRQNNRDHHSLQEEAALGLRHLVGFLVRLELVGFLVRLELVVFRHFLELVGFLVRLELVGFRHFLVRLELVGFRNLLELVLLQFQLLHDSP